MNWTSEAEQALREVPFFVRPAVRRKIEALATDHKQELIDEAFYKEARAKFSRRSP
ncbi:light-independent protochlorophyllide reductase C-terminal domain-like protein [Synechococcus sp. PROS-7-1]|nr:PCP reductase family protein [Synechococcus sp. BS307-5m-G39]MBL6801222.1 PCP reductase family protein [Synechococcus sp. BS307-5m-G37]QNI84265.1 light-independent protochlorophyllide reductase C-terminal domain-like protein [Synechococcus sp. PROS-7-1]